MPFHTHYLNPALTPTRGLSPFCGCITYFHMHIYVVLLKTKLQKHFHKHIFMSDYQAPIQKYLISHISYPLLVTMVLPCLSPSIPTVYIPK